MNCLHNTKMRQRPIINYNLNYWVVSCACLSLVLAIGILSGANADAQTPTDHRLRVNEHVVMIQGGRWGGTYNEVLADIATIIHARNEIRVVPIVGEGSVQAVEDLLYLRGIDVAIMQSDVLDFYLRENIFPNIADKLRIIGKIYNEEVHILANRSIESIFDLEGLRVNFGPITTGGFLTADNIFSQLGIDVVPTSFDHVDALRQLETGEIAGLVRVTGAPNDFFADLTSDDNFHLLSIPQNLVTGAYIPSEISNTHYSGLVAPGFGVPTLAVGAVMAVYNFPPDHPRRQRIERFYTNLRRDFSLLRDPRFHVKLQEFEFGDAGLSGWKPFRRSGHS